MPNRTEIKIAGFGGQGVVLAGYILGKAGSIYSNKHATLTQSYGPEARLGTAKCDLVLSRHEIAYPQVRVPDFLLCLSREAYLKYGQDLAPGGVHVVDARALEEGESADVVAVAITETAKDMGNILTTNTVALGALIGLTGLVSDAELRHALRARLKAEALPVNEMAFDAGLHLGALARTSFSPV